MKNWRSVIVFDVLMVLLVILLYSPVQLALNPLDPNFFKAAISVIAGVLIAYEVIKVISSGGDKPSVDDVLSIIGIVSGGPYDYLLFDFPGHFTEDEPAAYLSANDFIDYIAIPMDTDRQSRLSAFIVASSLKGCGVPFCLFWNRASSLEEKGGKRLSVGAEPFLRNGMDVMKEKIRDLKMFSRDSSELAFIRSTICFPEKYINMRSPSVIPFLEALSHRIDSF